MNHVLLVLESIKNVLEYYINLETIGYVTKTL